MNSYGTHDAFTDFKNAFDLNDLSTTSTLLMEQHPTEPNKSVVEHYFLITGSSYLPCTTLGRILTDASCLDSDVTITAHSKPYELKYPLYNKRDYLGVLKYFEEIGLSDKLTDVEKVGSNMRGVYIDAYKMETAKQKRWILKSDKKIHESVTDKLRLMSDDYSTQQGEFSDIIHSNPFTFDLKPGNITGNMVYGHTHHLSEENIRIGTFDTSVIANICADSDVEMPINNSLIKGIDYHPKFISASFGNPDAIFKDLIIKATLVGQKKAYNPLNLKVSSSIVDDNPNDILRITGEFNTIVPPHAEYQLLVRDGANIDEKTLNDAMNLFRF